MAVNPKKLRPYDEPPKVRRSLIPNAPDSAATGYLVFALLWLTAAAGIGMLWVASLLFPEQLTLGIDMELPIIGTLSIDVSAATVQSGFVNAVVFGWLSNAAFAAILFITPRLLGVRLVAEPMAWLGIGLWNVGVAAGLASVYLPAVSSAGLLSEFPLPIDGLLLLALLLVNGSFWRTLLAAGRQVPYVSIWFFGIALLAFLGVYTLGTGLPLLGLDDTALGLVAAFVARAIATYWVLGVALGSLLYVVPRAAGAPLASSGMALLGWLLWAGLAGLSAVGALADPSVPYVITSLGHVGSMLLVAPVFLVVATLALSLQGRWSLLLATGTIPFAVVAMAFLIGTALLEAAGALTSVQDLVRGTEWGFGVWIWSTLGAASFAAFAFADHAAPRMLRRAWRGTWLSDVQLWSGLAGAALAGLALVGAGIAHGSLITDGAAADAVSGTLAWFRIPAAGALGLSALAGLAGLVSLFLIYTTARRADFAVIDAAETPARTPDPSAPGAAGATASGS